MSVLDVSHISKSFGNQTILNDVNLSFSGNKIYGLLGRNGAGKSTLLNIITNRLLPNGGKVTINGDTVDNNDEALSHLFLMSEVNMYSNGSKLSKIIDDTELLYGSIDRQLVTELADKFELDLNQRFGKLSTGYRSIFKLILALCLPVEYVLLDEPVLGLDASHRELFYSEMLKTYADRPRNFIISTHLIEEIATIISDVIVLDHGHVLLHDTAENVLAQSSVVVGPKADVEQYTQDLNVIGKESIGQLAAFYIYGELNDRPIPDTVKISPVDLQKIFIFLTNYTNGGNGSEK